MWNQATLLNTTVGSYHLIDFLGAGGMGEVYRAVRPSDGQVVAVKVLAASNSHYVARFQKEAQLHAQFHHPHIVQLYDVLEIDGQPALVMEYVDGLTLEEHLRQYGPFAVGTALSIVRAVADAADAIHQRGIVHRDIKTGNIKITGDSRVKLLDFGIAKRPDAPGLTRTGAVVGTPNCLAPEQVRGQEISPATDIWALGVLLYEMITGHVPFEADDPISLYEKIVRANFLPPSVVNPSVPAPVDAIVGRCLRRLPAQRYASASALRDALARAPLPSESQLTSSSDSSSAPNWIDALRQRISTGSLRAILQSRVRMRPVLAFGFVILSLVLYLSGPGLSSKGPTSAALHELTIQVAGAPATVYVDGQRRGITPYRLQAPIGAPVELELRRDGFQPKVIRFAMPSTRSTFQETLTPLP